MEISRGQIQEIIKRLACVFEGETVKIDLPVTREDFLKMLEGFHFVLFDRREIFTEKEKIEWFGKNDA